MKLSHKITYLMLNQIKKFLSSISTNTRFIISNHLASFLYHCMGLRKKQAIKNMHRSFPSWTQKKILHTLRKTYIFFAYNFIQFLAVPKSWEDINIDVIGEEILATNLKKGKGVILISGHFGAWEIFGKWLGEYANLFAGIALRQKNRGANQFFYEQRILPGTKQFYKKDGIEKSYELLSKNGILGLISDQDAKGKGIFVNFFGTPASTPKGPALFHLNTSAPLLVGICVQKEFNQYEIRFIPLKTESKDIFEITQEYTNILENCIKKYPEQYFWFHRRWKTKLKKND